MSKESADRTRMSGPTRLSSFPTGGPGGCESAAMIQDLTHQTAALIDDETCD